jgi:transcriptional regulator with XRE-family HTH domain
MPVSEFAVLLRRLLTERGMSMRALARQVPVDAGQLSRVLNGRRSPHPELARRCDTVFGTGDLLERAALRERQGLPDGAEGEVSARWGVTRPCRQGAIPTTETSGLWTGPDPWRTHHPTTERVDRSAGQGDWLAGFAALAGASWPGTRVDLSPAGIGSTDEVPPMARLGLPGGLVFDGATLSMRVEPAAGLADGVVRLQLRPDTNRADPPGRAS